MNRGVMYFHSLYAPHMIGGAEISTQILAEGMSKHCPVSVVTVGPNARSEGIQQEERNGATLYRLPYNNLYWLPDKERHTSIVKLGWHLRNMYNYAQKRLVDQLLDSVQPALIHTQNLSGISLAVWQSAYERRIPIAHTLRDYALLEPMKLSWYCAVYRKLAARKSRYVHSVIGISRFILNEHLRHHLFPQAERYTVANAVVPLKEADGIGWRGGGGSPALRLGFVGQLEPNKGVDVFLDAVRQLPEQTVREAIVIGEGTQRQRLEGLHAGDSRIRFTGKLSLEETVHRMSTLDALIVPSIWNEPFGRVIIEAYQAGTPVLASKVGGIPEVIIDPGHLFQSQNRDSLQQAIIRLRNMDPMERAALRQRCHSYAQKFSVEENIRQHLDIYARCTEQFAAVRLA